jgi:hypothetical protein
MKVFLPYSEAFISLMFLSVCHVGALLIFTSMIYLLNSVTDEMGALEKMQKFLNKA